MNGQQLHRVLVVPTCVSQPKLDWLVILYPGTLGVRDGEGDKRPRAILHLYGGGRDRHKVVKTNLPPLSGDCWWGNTGSNGEGCLLKLISQPTSLKLAFSKSQQYKTLFFFSLLTNLYIHWCLHFHVLLITSTAGVCWDGSSECILVFVESCSSLRWIQTFLSSADSGMKANSVAEAQHRQEQRDGRCSFLKIFLWQIPQLDNTNQDMLVRGWLLLLFTLVQGEHRKIPFSTTTLDPRGEKKQVFLGGGLTGVQDVNS